MFRELARAFFTRELDSAPFPITDLVCRIRCGLDFPNLPSRVLCGYPWPTLTCHVEEPNSEGSFVLGARVDDSEPPTVYVPPLPPVFASAAPVITSAASATPAIRCATRALLASTALQTRAQGAKFRLTASIGSWLCKTYCDRPSNTRRRSRIAPRAALFWNSLTSAFSVLDTARRSLEETTRLGALAPSCRARSRRTQPRERVPRSRSTRRAWRPYPSLFFIYASIRSNMRA